MRKLFLALTSIIALVAFTSLSATAFASDVSDPDCDQYGNPVAIYGLHIETPPTDLEYEVSGVTGGALACGSAIHQGDATDTDPDIAYPGWKTLNKKAVINDAPGVLNSEAPSTTLPVGTYVGDTEVDSMTWLTIGRYNNPMFIEAQTAYIRVDDKAKCLSERNDIGDPVEPISTCYRAKVDNAVIKAESWIWIIEDQGADPVDSKSFTIGPLHNLVQPNPAGITEIVSMELCEYAGEIGVQGTPGACGTDATPEKWVHKTGEASAPDCNSGMGPEGIYTAYVTNWNGETSDITDESTTCIVWEPLPPTVETTITSAPESYSGSDSATFEFESSEPNSTFACKHDSLEVDCNENNEEGENGTGTTGSVKVTGLNPVENPADHTFLVTATDEAGNADPTPARHDWTVIDIYIRVTSAPDELSGSNSATFEFETNMPESTGLKCKLFDNGIDYSSWGDCDSGTITYPNLSDTFNAGQHTFQVMASGEWDGHGHQRMATNNWTVIDTLITSVPSTDSTDASFEFVSNVPDSKFECKLDVGGWSDCNAGTITYPNQDTGVGHNFSVRATGPDGSVADDTPATHDWTVPSVKITDGPPSRTTSRAASFEFTSPVAGATFQCKLDSGNWGACSSPKAYTGLGDGEHNFSVKRTGTNDADTKNWEVYTPNTNITKKPSNTTLDATFKFGSDASDSKYQCKLDGGAWEACDGRTITYQDLSVDEGHSFSVRATGVDGDNTDQTPATHDWTIPSVNLSGPSPSSFGQTTSTDATFEFTSPVAGATFQCKLDSGNWGACSSPKAYTGLSIGEHTVSVRTDGGSTVPASRTWTINPEVKITNDPPGSTTFTDATFEFTSNVAGATFKCKLDDGIWRTCSSPKTYTGLSVDQEHSFSVEAFDAGGNSIDTADHSWFVLSEVNTWISAEPTDGTTSRDATFEYGGDVDNVQFECKLDGGAWEDAGGDCSSRTKTYTGLPTDEHTFSVRAIETGGGVPDPSPATYEWCINSSKASSRGLSTCRPQLLIRPLTLGL